MARYHQSDVEHEYNDVDDTVDRFRFGAMRRGGQLPLLNSLHKSGSGTGGGGGSVHDPGGGVGSASVGGHSETGGLLADGLPTNANGGISLSEPKIDESLKTCRNSVQGKLLISDDQGYVCYRKDLTNSGCCNPEAASSRRHACDTCTEHGCCAIFEYCVSCCLEPAKKPLLSKLIAKSSNGGFPSNVLYASLTDHFEFCLARCRTSSQSVQHENSYRDPKNKHCFVDVTSAANTELSLVKQVTSSSTETALIPKSHADN